MTDILGSPSDEDMKFACNEAKDFIKCEGKKPTNLHKLYALHKWDCSKEVVSFLCKMLVYNPVSLCLEHSTFQRP